MKIEVCGLVLAGAFAASAAPLPGECKPPASGVQAIRDNPSAKVYDAVGAWFAEQGNLKCAVAAFEEAVRLEPHSAEAHYDLGVALVRVKQLPAAAAEFRLTLRYKPDMTLAHNSLGSVLIDMEKPAEAAAEFREALKWDPNSVFALDHLAQQLASERRYAAAIRYWKQALALQPNSPEIVLSMGIAVYQSGDPNESIRILAALVKTHPDMQLAHFTLGNVSAREGRFREAADEYTEVVRLDPEDYVALLAKVKALVTVSAFQDALADAQEYARRKPGDPEGHLMLGSAYRGLGEYEPAEAELKPP